MLKSLHGAFLTFGVDFAKMWRSTRGVPAYLADFSSFRRQLRSRTGSMPMGKLYPCLEDRYAPSGSASSVYFQQDLLVAQRVHANAPRIHVDVGSRIDGFVAHVASFRPIEVFDIRPLENGIANVHFRQADFMRPLDERWRGYCDSLSCLHALEHFGLGRYGDPVCADGHVLGFENLVAMLTTGGKLYLSVPIGPSRVEFNAHRVFGVQDVIDLAGDRLRFDSVSFIDDLCRLHQGAALTAEAVATSFGCRLGCGIFELTKLR